MSLVIPQQGTRWRWGTYNESGDNSNDDADNVDLVWRPDPVERGFERFNNSEFELRREPGAEDHKDSGEYKDDRRDSKQEHGSRGMGQGPLGAAGEGEKGTFECSRGR